MFARPVASHPNALFSLRENLSIAVVAPNAADSAIDCCLTSLPPLASGAILRGQMIPVMLFGVLFAKKQYSLQEYLCVALITVGIVTFNLSGKAHNKEVRGVRTVKLLVSIMYVR